MTDQSEAINAAEAVYARWADAAARNHVEDLLACFTDDAIIESPLVSTMLQTESGIIQGRDQLRKFFEVVFSRKPDLTHRHRQNFFTDGRSMIWEYPRVTPRGTQPDLAEVMELEDGKIRAYRVYWGWHGTQLLQTDTYGDVPRTK